VLLNIVLHVMFNIVVKCAVTASTVDTLCDSCMLYLYEYDILKIATWHAFSMWSIVTDENYSCKTYT
jgi:hypothetical protein